MSKRSMAKPCLLGSVALSLPLLAAMPAQAQTAPVTLEEIVVTARKVSENIQDIPLSITALSGDALEDRSVREVRDLSATVPNVVIQASNNDPGSATVAIRGQTQAGILLTLDSSVGLYFDGVNIPRAHGLRTALVDIQRVEVLRGPQGTLYGRNTTGGAVSFVTKDPTERLEGYGQVTLGNYDQQTALGVVNLPLSDNLAVRVVAQKGKRDGYGENANGHELESEDTTYFRTKAKWTSENVTALLTADYFDHDAGGGITKLVGLSPAFGTTPEGGAITRQAAAELGLPATAAGWAAAAAALKGQIGGDPYRTTSIDDTFSDNKGQSVALSVDWSLDDSLTLRSVTGYRGFTTHNLIDLDGSSAIANSSRQNTDADFYSEELQLLGDGEGFNWVLGAYASYEEGNENSIANSTPALNANARTFLDGDVENESRALFAQGNYQLTSALTLTLGARYTWETKKLVSRNRILNANGTVTTRLPVQLQDDPAVCTATPANCTASFSDTYSDPSWLASLNYKITDDVMVYGKVTRGFRGGGQNLRGLSTVINFTPFEPETVTEYEAGLKASLADNRLRLNLAVYQDDYKDVQRQASVIIAGAQTSLITNAASAKLRGAEAEIDWLLTDELSLRGNVGYNHAKYDSFPDATLGDRSGEDWPTPDWTYAIGARYEAPVSFGSASVQVDYAGQSKQSMVPSARATADLIRQPGYALLDARVTFKVDAWDADVALFGRNLTDKTFYSSGFVSEAKDAATGLFSGYASLNTGAPRTFGVTVTKRF